jgi:hypothetical protein
MPIMINVIDHDALGLLPAMTIPFHSYCDKVASCPLRPPSMKRPYKIAVLIFSVINWLMFSWPMSWNFFLLIVLVPEHLKWRRYEAGLAASDATDSREKVFGGTERF